MIFGENSLWGISKSVPQEYRMIYLQIVRAFDNGRDSA